MSSKPTAMEFDSIWLDNPSAACRQQPLITKTNDTNNTCMLSDDTIGPFY